jgi:hypothetical protein
MKCYRNVNQKSTRRYQLITVRTAFVLAGEVVEKREPSYADAGTVSC